MPAASRADGSRVLRPATATVVTPAARAAAATPAGALPRRVWSSSEPSPVTTSRAPWIAARTWSRSSR